MDVLGSDAVKKARFIMDISQIKEHFSVQAKEPGSANEGSIQIGVVDRVEGDQLIKLTQNDSADGQHHWFPIDWIERIDQETLYLNKTPAEVKAGLLNSPDQLQSQASPTIDIASGAGVD
jgi:hypothetical protein